MNIIVRSYLSFWFKNKNINFVNRISLELNFKLQTRKIITLFFIDEKISVDDYILFVCFFTFFSYEDIVSLMVSMIGISSKLFITKEQLNLFFVKYGLDRNEFGDLNKVLYLTKPSLPEYI